MWNVPLYRSLLGDEWEGVTVAWRTCRALSSPGHSTWQPLKRGEGQSDLQRRRGSSGAVSCPRALPLQLQAGQGSRARADPAPRLVSVELRQLCPREGARMELGFGVFPEVQGCREPWLRAGSSPAEPRDRQGSAAQHGCARGAWSFHPCDSHGHNVPASPLGLPWLFCATLHCKGNNRNPALPGTREKVGLNPRPHVVQQGWSHGSRTCTHPALLHGR